MDKAARPAIAIAVLALGATLWPLVRDPADPKADGFPLSTYPMFAEKRARLLQLAYPLGETASGERRTLSPSVVGTHEPIQAIVIVNQALGRGEAKDLCARIAARVAEETEDIAFVRIVRGTHDAIDLVRDGTLGKETDYARCPVPR